MTKAANIMRITSGFVASLMACLPMAWSSSHAEPTPPPLFCVDEVCVEGGDGYSLSSIGPVPFTYNSPQLPNITSEAIVTPSSIAANKVNGRRIILTPGNYGNQAFSTRDQEIILQEGVELGAVNISGTRLAIRGVPARAHTIYQINMPTSSVASDILLDGLNVDDRAGATGNLNIIYGHRIAILGSSFRQTDYALFSGLQGDLSDVIVANSSFNGHGGAQAIVRLTGMRRLVFVDNRIVNTGGGHHTFRLHAATSGPQTTDLYVARNQLEVSGTMIAGGTGSPSLGMRDVWFEENHLFWLTNTVIYYGESAISGDIVEALRLKNNVLYADPEGRQWPGRVRPTWTVENNTKQAYRTPPAWTFR